MNFVRINRAKQLFLTDPFKQMQSFRECARVLSSLVEKKEKLLLLGFKNRTQYFQDSFKLCPEVIVGDIDEGNYSFIVCFDPIIYKSKLKGINRPIMSIASQSEVIRHPEIVSFSDYLMILPRNGPQ